jgi:hypothetical protein
VADYLLHVEIGSRSYEQWLHMAQPFTAEDHRFDQERGLYLLTKQVEGRPSSFLLLYVGMTGMSYRNRFDYRGRRHHAATRFAMAGGTHVTFLPSTFDAPVLLGIEEAWIREFVPPLNRVYRHHADPPLPILDRDRVWSAFLNYRRDHATIMRVPARNGF